MRHHTLCKYLLLAAAVCYTTFGCAQVAPVSNSIDNIKIPEPALGDGYSNDNDQPIGTACLYAGQPKVTGSNKGTVDLSTNYDLRTIENQLNIWGDVNVDVGLFSSDLSVDFMHYIENDDLSETLVYRTSLEFRGSEYTTPTSGPVLNSTGQAHASNPDDFRQACGDSFISQTHNGAYLYIFYQLHFLRSIDKTTFDTHFSEQISDFATLTAAMQDEVTKLHIQGGIHVFGYQIGGDPTALSAIFQSPNPLTPTPLSECNFDDLAACNMVMTNIINYVTPTYPNSFPNQFVYTPDGAAPANAAITGIEQLTYDTLIPSLHSNSKLTPQITAARNRLGTLLVQTQTYLQRAQYLLNTFTQTYAYDVFRNNLSTQVGYLQANEKLLNNTGLLCFNDLDNCVKAANQTYWQLHKIDTSALNIPATFDVVTNISGQATTEQLFVAVDTTNPQDQTYRGIEISPNPNTVPSNLRIDFNQPSIQIAQLDPNSGDMIALYVGGDDGQGQYSGNVTTYNRGHVGPSGTWTATFSSSETLQLNK